MKQKILEVCVDSVESALAAERGGADRLELCQNLVIGGTTPSPKLFETIRRYSKIPIHVLLRPRFGDFCYTQYEFEMLREEVTMYRKLGAEGVVIGMLLPEGTLDIRRMEKLMEAAEGMPVTLHRAFDVCKDPKAALKQATELGIQTILTSGQQNSALKGAPLLKELKEQENKEQNQARVWRSQGSVVQMRLEQCMRNLVHTKADKEMQLYILQKDFQFDIKQKMSLILLEQGMYTEQQNDGKFRAMTVKNVCMSMVDSQNRGITFVDDDGTIAIVCFEKDDDDSVLEQIEELSDVLKDEFEYKPKITVGSAVQGFENLAISYNDARYLLEHEKKNIQDIIQTMGAQNKKKIFWEIYAELRNIMISNIGTPDYVLKAFNTFTKATESYNLSPSAVRRCCFEIASSLIFSYMEESCEVEEGKLDALSKSLSSAGKEEACEITRMFIEQLIENDEEDVHYTISNARHYIDEHLAEDISVSSIAESLYITPNYFSRLFKRITGEGCNEYIVRKRIEKAKSLLETTSIKTGKIAMMVGYRDTNYFSLAFKKHTGKSPTKYREEMQNT